MPAVAVVVQLQPEAVRVAAQAVAELGQHERLLELVVLPTLEVVAVAVLIMMSPKEKQATVAQA